MRLLTIFCLTSVVLVAGCQPKSGSDANRLANTSREAYGKRYALLIGINEYSDWDNLKCAVRDAVEVGRVLQEHYGFTTDILSDDENARAEVLASTIQDAIRKLSQKGLTERDCLLVFFAGHGAEGYIAAHNSTKGGIESDGVAVAWLVAQMRDIPAHKALILDCCYAGSLFDETPDGGEAKPAGGPGARSADSSAERIRFPERALNTYLSHPCFWGISASRDTIALEPSNPDPESHSYFTDALLSELRERCDSTNEDHWFRIDKLGTRIRDRLDKLEDARQDPACGPVPNTGDGVFIFRQVKDIVTPTERREVAAYANGLLEQSRRKQSTAPELSLLLASEAVGVFPRIGIQPPRSAITALKDALAVTGGFPLPGEAIFSPSSRCVAIDDGRTTSLFDLARMSVNQTPLPPRDKRVDLRLFRSRDTRFSPSGRSLFVPAADGLIGARLIDSEVSQVFTLSDIGAELLEWAVSPDETTLVTGYDHGRLIAWGLRSRDPNSNPRQLTGPTDPISDIVFSQDGRWLVVRTLDSARRDFIQSPYGRSLHVWDLQSPPHSREPSRILSAAAEVTRFLFVPGSQHLIMAGADGQCVCWNVEDGHGQVLVRHSGSAPDIMLGRSGEVCVTRSIDSGVHFCDLTAPDRSFWLLDEDGFRGDCFLSPDGRWLLLVRMPQLPISENVTRSMAGVLLYDLQSMHTTGASASDVALQESMRIEELDSERAVSLIFAFSADGNWLCIGHRDGTIQVWDLQMANPTDSAITLFGHAASVRALAFAPDSRFLFSGDGRGEIRRWEMAGYRNSVSTVLRGHESEVARLSVSGDGKWLLSEPQTGMPRLWRTDVEYNNALPLPLVSAESGIASHATNCNARWVAAAVRGDPTVRLFDLESPDPSTTEKVLTGHAEDVTKLAFAANGNLLVSGSDDGTVRLWQLPSVDEPRAIVRHEDAVIGMWVSPDGRLLFTASMEDAMLTDLSSFSNRRFAAPVWEYQSNEEISSIVAGTRPEASPGSHERAGETYFHPVGRVVFSPDRNWLVIWYDPLEPAWLWRVNSPQPAEPKELLPHKHFLCLDVAFDPTSRWLAYGTSDGEVVFWPLVPDSESLEPAVLQAHASPVKKATFSRRGRWLVTVSEAAPNAVEDSDAGLHYEKLNSIVVWRAEDRPEIAFALRSPPNEPFLDAALGEDERTLVVTEFDGTPQFWDFRNRRMLDSTSHQFPPKRPSVPAPRWTIDAQDRAISLWLEDPLQLIDLARRVAGRDLTQRERQQFRVGSGY